PPDGSLTPPLPLARYGAHAPSSPPDRWMVPSHHPASDSPWCACTIVSPRPPDGSLTPSSPLARYGAHAPSSPPDRQMVP
ncbi:hypothetical protein BD779DRAFT_1424417, partial [Infundibulicybe gibba]